ncbi:hypothetical protein, partial [Aurantimonas sp. C2-3-R2]|uniref:hypothetical protein n=2 Tax=unclassified Aurantimonas TaxID=2638230 RepID=UPI002E17EB56|nr:hypothetical protein [Aurantimonas sp. C2-3-R2]
RLERGWSDDEIIEGKRSAQLSEAPPKSTTVPSRTSPPARSFNAPPPPPRLSAAEIAFAERAEEYRQHREEHGEEDLDAPYEVWVEFLAPHPLTPEQYERNFAKHWPKERPHVIYENLPLSQRELIKKIDPDYVAALSEKAAMRKLLADKL